VSVNAIRRATAAAILVFGVVLGATVAAGAAGTPHKRVSAPDGLRIVRTTQSTVTLAWNKVRNGKPVSYGMYRNGMRVGKSDDERETFDGLDCGRRYSFAVDAVEKKSGMRSERSTITTSTAACADRQPPSKPSGLTATSVTQTSVTLSWTASSDNVGVVGYVVSRADDDDSTGATAATSFRFDNLKCGKSYVFGVIAVDAARNRSDRATLSVSTAACPAPPPPGPGRDREPPSKPTALTATSATRNSVSLAWTASTDNVGVAGYELYVDGHDAGQATTTSATIGGLDCAHMYAFSVEAYDKAANHSGRTTLATSTATCMPAPDTQPPSPITGLAATTTTTTSVAVSWNAATDNVGVVSYGLYRDDVKVGDATTTSATFSGLDCSTTHTFAVDAVDAAGNRSPQVSIQASTAACTNEVFVAKAGNDYNWTHLAATYDPSTSTLRIYENGAKVAEMPVSGDILASNGQIRIGGEPLANISANVWFDGLIDDLRIYKKALGATQIQADMAASATTSSPAAGLVAAYAFDAGSGTTAVDSSGNNNDGTIANADWATGKHGGALLFDGKDSVVTVNDSASLDDFSAGITLEAWVQPRSLNGWNTVVARDAPSDVAWGLYANSPQGVPEAEVYTNGGVDYGVADGTAQIPGNDCSRANPCQTFNRAYHVAQPGYAVEVAGGSYPGETIGVDPTKASAANVVFEPADGASVTVGDLANGLGIDGDHVTVRDMTIPFWVATGTDITVDGIKGQTYLASARQLNVIGGDYGPYAPACAAGASFPAHDNPTLSPINGQVPTDVVIRGGSYHDMSSVNCPGAHMDCLQVAGASHLTITGVKFFGCDANDLIMTGDFGVMDNITIENSWFGPTVGVDGNGGPVSLNWNATRDCPGAVVRYNTFIASGFQVACSVDSSLQLYGNIVPSLSDFDCSAWKAVSSYNVGETGTATAACGPGSYVASGGMAFVNSAAHDYHLAPGSAAIDRGDPNRYPATDIDGQTRPMGLAPDAGADEAG